MQDRRAPTLRRASGLLAIPLAIAGAMVPAPSLASGPTQAPGTGGEPPSDAGVIIPLTPGQAASKEQKLAVLAQISAASGGASPMACPPEGCPPPPPSSYLLATYARHQHRWFYCGPAVVQVVSNYTWGYYNNTTSGETTSNNRYLQSYISSHWTRTDTNGQTLLADEITGMNSASVKPTGWYYIQWNQPTFEQFHNAIIEDTWSFNMPLAAGVNPRSSTNGTYYLPEWASVPPSDTYGHYIALRGYNGLYSNPSRTAYYDDSSGGYDEVNGWVIYGSTGAYSYGSYGVWETMRNDNNNFIY